MYSMTQLQPARTWFLAWFSGLYIRCEPAIFVPLDIALNSN